MCTMAGCMRQLGRPLARRCAAAPPWRQYFVFPELKRRISLRPGAPASPQQPGRRRGSGSAARRQVATAASRQREELLKGVDKDNREDVARIIEQAERALDSWAIVHTDFYAPPVIGDAARVLGRVADLAALPWGGYASAERCRLVLGREELLAPLRDDPARLAEQGGVAALAALGNFMFDAATHRDFLGATLGTGVERSRVGDIVLVGERGAQLLVDPGLVEHLQRELTQVRTVPVATAPIPLDGLRVPAPRTEETTSVESSLRLDAVASAGFRLSRSRMADLIKAGDVRVNWRPAPKAAADVKAGDVISVAGKGRLEVAEASLTKKGKWAVRLVRYV